jgi:ATP-dependent RNA helicase RhlE
VNPFELLGLAEHLLRAVEAQGYVAPTPVQQSAIPAVLAGRDVLAEAETGSGKTAAFALPILDGLVGAQTGAGVLILVPTRELALQVAAVFKKLSRYAPTKPEILAVIGGEDIEQQMAALHRGVHILVATPGRLADLVERGEVDLSQIHTLVLDEADKLLKPGFRDEVDPLLAQLPTARQTLLFSATLPPELLAEVAGLTQEPVVVRIADEPVAPQTLSQRTFLVDRDKRRLLLQHLVASESWGQCLVFVSTRRAAENLSAKLRSAGVSAAALHGKLDQAERGAVLSQFKAERFRALIATDLAARGIDIPGLAVVVNFDLPRSPTDYLHRIGRAGRAGAAGQAVTLVSHDTEPHMRLIEKRSQVRLERLVVPGFEPSAAPPKRTKGPAAVKGKRKSKKDKLRQAAAVAASEAAPATVAAPEAAPATVAAPEAAPETVAAPEAVPATEPTED